MATIGRWPIIGDDPTMTMSIHRRTLMLGGFSLLALYALQPSPLMALDGLPPSPPDPASVGAMLGHILLDDGRSVDLWSWLPRRRSRGTIIFSHGAASAPWKYERLIRRWVEAGYTVHAPLHVDSTDHPDHDRFAPSASWPARIADMRALADRHGAAGYVAAGHSYGGLMALALGGASPVTPADVQGALRDARVQAVIAFSPPGPIPGFAEPAAFATLAVPALIQTGTADVPPGATDWRGHLAAWEAPPAGNHRYALVLEGVDHYFKGAFCRPELPGPPQLAELDLAATLSIEMIEGFARNRRSARRAIDRRLSDSGPVQLRLR